MNYTELVSKKFDFIELKLFLNHSTVQFSSVQFSSQFTRTVAKFNSSGKLGPGTIAPRDEVVWGATWGLRHNDPTSIIVPEIDHWFGRPHLQRIESDKQRWH